MQRTAGVGLTYQYDAADQRVHKRQADANGQVELAEYVLRDLQGRELGVLDMRNAQWTWYLHAGQRFAKMVPARKEQPAFYAADLGERGDSRPLPLELQSLLAFLQQELLRTDTLRYPLQVVKVVWVGDTLASYMDSASYLALDTALIQWAEPISFGKGTDALEIRRNDQTKGWVTEVTTLDALLGQAQQRQDPGSNPGVYTYRGNSSRIQDITFFEHDHLGNLRVAYTPVMHGQDPVEYTLEHVVDYYPYGAILREYVNGRSEKYLTTQHERDQETGLDYRGARFYDSDVARFLSLDPLAADYASWSPYNYVMGNPVSLIDPTGKSATEYRTKDGRTLLDTDDGRDIIVTVPDRLVKPMEYFAANNSQEMLNSPEWNSTMTHTILKMGGTWDRTFGQKIQDAFNIAMNQWTDPQLVLTGLSAGASGLSSLTNAPRSFRSAVPNGHFYSVAFEAKLSPASFPGRSRSAHFQEANGALLNAMKNDASMARGMGQLGVNVERTATGLAPRQSPNGWTWHHAAEPGVMQLVPRWQHAPGSMFQSTLHPGGRGGMAIWGR